MLICTVFRTCVIATNVAETSLTIPAVRYVVDSGREKCRFYDPVTGVSQFRVTWISQASADQRAGRAGRVQAGDVYRLYSSAVYSDFEKFTPPEILTKPIDQLVLHLKSMNIIKKEARINGLGKTLAIFPLSPAFAKMLVMANQHSLLAYTCCLVAALSVREPLIPLYSIRGENPQQTQTLMLESLKQRFSFCPLGQARNFGDLAVLMRVVLAAEAAKGSEEECRRLGIRPKALIEIRKLRQQLTKIINTKCMQQQKPLELCLDLKSPSDHEFSMLRQILTASLTDNIARRVDPVTVESAPKGAYECQKLKRKDKKCMQNVMSVEESWYDPESDNVVVCMDCTFSDRRWPLGKVEQPLPLNILLYRYFAQFFLDGAQSSTFTGYLEKQERIFVGRISRVASALPA
ncbi:unnamed protein product [Gongylonema pulchrum]|uniref:Helicase C-terminal domain-containing protein n=1 Tax=Gongylonema pulchrum TaxID=637853 RepID=A0A3P7MY50_9BILA|nr:unnamed protein product [Gongylonema pulchrum]